MPEIQILQDIAPLTTAASELKQALERQLPNAAEPLKIHLATRDAGSAIAERLLSRQSPLMDPSLPRDAFHVWREGREIYSVGAGGLGAIYAALAVAEHLNFTPNEPLERFQKPRFSIRTLGHNELYLPPNYDWTHREHLKWLVRHGFNSVDLPWHVLNEDHLSETLQSLPQLEEFDLNAFLQGKLFQHVRNPPAEALGLARTNAGHVVRPVCLRSAWGREHFANWIRTAADSSRIKGIAWYFFDVAFICNHECPRCEDTPLVDRALEFIAWAQAVANEQRDDLTMFLRTWHFMPNERLQLNERLPPGAGLESKLSQAGDELYLPIPKYDPNYGPHEREAMRRYGARVMIETPIANCESVDSVVGLPLPYLTLKRLDDLACWGGPSVRNWWGAAETTYSPNYEVAQKAFFEPTESAEEIVHRVARRDFGDALAADMVFFWQRAERLITRWPVVSWMQRFEIFTDRSYGAIQQPATYPIRPEPFELMLSDERLLKPSCRDFRRLIPRELESDGSFKEHPLDWITPALLRKYEVLLDGFPSLIAEARKFEDRAEGHAKTLVQQQWHSVAYFASILHTQYAFFKALYLAACKRDATRREDKCQCDDELAKLAKAEISNCQSMIHLLQTDPNPNTAHFSSGGCRPKELPQPLVDGQLEIVRNRIESMRAWLELWEPFADAGIPYAPYISVDTRFFVWGDPTLREVQLVDQSRVVGWHSNQAAAWLFRAID